MQGLKIFFGFLILLIIVAGATGYFAPVKHTKERSITIQAPRFLVDDYVKHLKNWPLWSPWADEDPTFQTSVKGIDGKAGAVYRWKGNTALSGEGAMVLTGLNEYEIAFRLLFIQPQQGEAAGYLKLSGAGNTTIITRGFVGFTPFPWNVLMLFKNLDNLVGRDFDMGLKKLKALSERDFQIIQRFKVVETDFKGGKYAVIREKVDLAEIGPFLDESFKKIESVIGNNRKINKEGLPSGLFYNINESTDLADLAAAVPVNRFINSNVFDILVLGPAASYQTDYSAHGHSEEYAHRALHFYFNQQHLTQVPPYMEVYLVDRAWQADTTKWRTRLIYFAE